MYTQSFSLFLCVCVCLCHIFTLNQQVHVQTLYYVVKFTHKNGIKLGRVIRAFVYPTDNFDISLLPN